MRTALADYDPALASILTHVEPLPPTRLPLGDALGLVLRQDVVADRDQPPFERAAMDGFAVRSDQVAPGRCFCVTVRAAAGGPQVTMPDDPAAVAEIATGSPLPAGCDAVIPMEQAEIDSTGRPTRVRFTVESIEPGAHVHHRGSDAAAQQVLIKAGKRLRPQHIGIAATAGADHVQVSQPPRLTLLTSGDEVRPTSTPTDQIEPQQIRNSNGPMLEALLAALGAAPRHSEHLPDEPEQTLAVARECLATSHVVLTTGGVSVGHRDFLPWAWKQLGLETVIHGVAIQPGKPLLVAHDGSKLVMGLPGNPVSALATAHLFVWPVIDRLMGGVEPLPWRPVLLAETIQTSGRREVFRAARLLDDGRAKVIAWQGSGDLIHTAEAEGLVRLPKTRHIFEAGSQVAMLPLIR